MTPEIDITPSEAMVIAIVATEGFSSLDTAEMPPELLRGVVLLYEAIVRRIEPLLPRDADMDHVLVAIGHVKAIPVTVRERYHLPPLM